MKIHAVVSGADGFIGRNLTLRLHELGHEITGLTRSSRDDEWLSAIEKADIIFHLAGSNRPEDPRDFNRINAGTAAQLIETLDRAKRTIPIVYSSSVRAGGDDAYGNSKRAGEVLLSDYAKRSDTDLYIFRLPNVFGKWARPNYNSAVATFCHNIARDMPITIHDPDASLSLVYIDDLISAFIDVLASRTIPGFVKIEPVYESTVGAVADTIRRFRADRSDNMIETVGIGLTRALYATYVAALPPEQFSYPITSHRDPRGAFSEMLKTRTSGQFSYFNALPGVTRGGHYHHTKTEKFLIVHGKASFRFRHVITGDRHEILTDGDHPTIVETVPGWAHDVTNVGNDVMVSLLWANEIFDRAQPDTIAAEI